MDSNNTPSKNPHVVSTTTTTILDSSDPLLTSGLSKLCKNKTMYVTIEDTIMKLPTANLLNIASNERSNLMRNVKREKTISLGSFPTSSIPTPTTTQQDDIQQQQQQQHEQKQFGNVVDGTMKSMTIAEKHSDLTSEATYSKDILMSNDSDNSSTARISDDEETEDLQKEYLAVLQENRKLKQKSQVKDVLKRKISMIKQENETLKSAHEQAMREDPKPDSSEAVSPQDIIDGKDAGVFAKSFLLTSTLGGIYIEPIDGSNGTGRVSLDNLSSSNSINHSPNSSFTKPEKKLKTVETQTLQSQPTTTAVTSSTTTSSSSSSNSSGSSSNSKYNNYHYSPRVKVATTEEDEEAHRFVAEFKARRIALKLTQSDIGEELNLRAGARYGQSYISRMESIQLSTAIVLRMKPLLLKLLEEKEEERRRLKENADFDEEEYQLDRKRKKRTNFTPEQSLLLTKFFSDQPRPSPQEIDEIARKIDVDRNSVKMWFNNKRQSEKFKSQPLPTIGSISSVGSINPYANPYASMPPSFLMTGLMSNMQNSINPIVTSASLNNLKIDYNNLAKTIPTTINLDSVASQGSSFVFSNKELNQLYENSQRAVNDEQKAKLSKDLTQIYQNSLNETKKSPKEKSSDSTPFSLASQPPFVFNKELLYGNRNSSEDSPTQKISSDLAALYKDRINGENNGLSFTSSPPQSSLNQLPTFKAISPTNHSVFSSLSQSLISRTLSQAAANQENSDQSCSPKNYSQTP